jgi:hypothetical protein
VNKTQLLAAMVFVSGLWPAWSIARAADALPATLPTTRRADVGERVPSEDPVLKDLHSLGLIDGRVNIFRCACPVRDLAKQVTTTQPSDPDLAQTQTQARARMQRLYDLGVRTVFSFQKSKPGGDGEGKPDETAAAIAMEESAAKAVGIRFVARPIANAGSDSIQTMSDAELKAWLDDTVSQILQAAQSGGVAFHCSAGHDRTGIVAAWIRIQHQHWPVDQAIEEMRRFGHNWVKYSDDGGVMSWHERHLRAMAEGLGDAAK